MAHIYLDADVKDIYAAMLTDLGHVVTTTAELGRRRADDAEQLAYAARHGLILVTHNTKDYLLLQHAWRVWFEVWPVEPRPLHSGILGIPQVIGDGIIKMADEIARFLRSTSLLTNRYYECSVGHVWVQKG